MIFSQFVIWFFICQYEILLRQNAEVLVKAEKRMLVLALGFSNVLLPGVVSGDRLIDVTTGPYSTTFYASPKPEFCPARFIHTDLRARCDW